MIELVVALEKRIIVRVRYPREQDAESDDNGDVWYPRRGVSIQACLREVLDLNASCSEDLLSLEQVGKLLGSFLSCQEEIINLMRCSYQSGEPLVMTLHSANFTDQTRRGDRVWRCACREETMSSNSFLPQSFVGKGLWVISCMNRDQVTSLQSVKRCNRKRPEASSPRPMYSWLSGE